MQVAILRSLVTEALSGLPMQKILDTREAMVPTLAYQVGFLVAAVCQELGWQRTDTLSLIQGALLHDIGKTALPETLWSKSSSLTAGDWDLVRQHPQAGHAILTSLNEPCMERPAQVALYHHEHFDGSGYPFGLAGEGIPLESRIVSICDVYDALRSPRSYKEAFSHQEVLQIMYTGDGRTDPAHFDPHLMALFRTLVEGLEADAEGGEGREAAVAFPLEASGQTAVELHCHRS